LLIIEFVFVFVVRVVVVFVVFVVFEHAAVFDFIEPIEQLAFPVVEFGFGDRTGFESQIKLGELGPNRVGLGPNLLDRRFVDFLKGNNRISSAMNKFGLRLAVF
jgi:hypothetical protein